MCFRLAFLHLTAAFALVFVPGVLLHEYAKGERKDGEKKDRRAEFGKVFTLKNVLNGGNGCEEYLHRIFLTE